jgi:drug/metabolite transporter (DMT)-like permease
LAANYRILRYFSLPNLSEDVIHKPWFIHFYALAAMLLWGISYIWSKIVFEYLEPATTVFFRLVISSVFLFLLLHLIGKHQKIKPADRKMFLLTALFNPFLYFVGESFGLDRVSPTISAVIIATIPIFMPFAAWFYLRERLRLINAIGLLISFIGVLVMVVDRKLGMTAAPEGIFFLLLAVFSAIVYGILLKKLTGHYSPITIIAYQNIIGIFYFLPLVLLLEWEQLLSVQINFRLLSNLLLLGIFASSLAFVFFVKAIKHLGIAKANIYTNIIPVFTALFSLWILHEIISLDKILGILLVIGGVAVSQQGGPSKLKSISNHPPIPIQYDKKKRYRFGRRPRRPTHGA